MVAGQSANDSLLFTFIHLRSGDVLIGRSVGENDTIHRFEEVNLGEITVAKSKIVSTRHVYRNAYVILQLGDNTRYSGKLIDADEQHYILESSWGRSLLIPKMKVVSLKMTKSPKKVWQNPNATRYFFAPSAIPLDKGDGYYQNAYLLSNSVNFGLTDNFTLGGGVIIPLLFYLTPKVGFKVAKNLYLGAGFIAGSTFIPGAIVSGGIPFGLITYGSPENNLTLGSGYGLLWNEGEFEHTHYPITTVNGMMRLSNRLHLVSENWIIPRKHTKEYYSPEEGYFDDSGIWVEPELIRTEEVTDLYMALSVGLRVLTGARSTVDFAPVYLYGEADGIMVPYLDFVYKF